MVAFNNNNNNNNINKWYTHMPKPVYEQGDVTVLWNQAVHTDREVTANRPDIIIKNKKQKTCTLIDVAIPADRNVVQKEAEKKLKYKSLCIEIQRMWKLKCTIITVIIGATGIIIILGISFMQGIYTYIRETNYVPREHCVATILM